MRYLGRSTIQLSASRTTRRYINQKSFKSTMSATAHSTIPISTETTPMKPEDIDTSKYEVLTEGSANILFPPNQVFYNPVQQYNRDLSCLAIKAWSEIYAEEKQTKKRNKQQEAANKKQKNDEAKSTETGAIEATQAHEDTMVSTQIDEQQPEQQQPYVHILEALSATGLRAIRYGKEIPLAAKVVANDLSSHAVKAIKLNTDYNSISHIVKPNEADAIQFMHNSKQAFHVIDLDPYGTATPFMDSAMNAIKDDGLLLVTCTDLGVLAGNGYPEKCFALYGGTNLWGDATHESALRLVLNMIASTAARHKKYIEPQLCLSIDFYVRLFIRVKTSPIKVKELASSTMITYKCSGCYAYADQYLGKCMENPNGKTKQNNKKFGLAKGPPVGPTCSFCGYTNHLTGPMYAGPLHNKSFIDKILQLQSVADESIYKTLPRIKGMLTVAANEVNGADTHFYFKTTTLSSVLKCSAPSIDVMASALGNLGYNASLTHAMTSAIKTNAPWEVIWFIGKKYSEKTDHNSDKMSKTSAGYQILNNPDIGKGINLAELKGDDKKDVDDLEWLFSHNDVSKKVKRLRNIKIVRYQENPTDNWGPKAAPKSRPH